MKYSDYHLHKVSLMKWMLKSYWKTALIPLLLVEVVFLGIFFLSQHWSTEQNISTLKQATIESLAQITEEESDEISYRFASIEHAIKIFSFATQDALQSFNTPAFPPVDAARMAWSPEGIYYSYKNSDDNNGTAIYYSGLLNPIGNSEKEKLARLSTLQPLMKNIKNANPLITMVYLDTFDSLGIFYPYFDTLKAFPPRTDITAFNFYYEANEQHNPARGICWTNAYLDLTGNGWMVTCLKPVYLNNKLECVTSIDVTIADILKYVLNLEIPYGGYAVLLDKEGTIIAMPPAGENDWQVKELTAQQSDDKTKTQFKPEIFNIHKRDDLKVLSDLLEQRGEKHTELSLNGKVFFVSWGTISGADWKLLLVIPRDNVFANINQINLQLKYLGYCMIFALLVFYSFFFTYLFHKNKQQCLQLTQAINSINLIIDNINSGKYNTARTEINITELHETAELLIQVGKRLGYIVENLSLATETAEQANSAKNIFLSNMSYELRAPLNIIMGFTYLLKGALKDVMSASQADDLQEVINASDHLLLLINQMLDLSAIEAGKLSFYHSKININKLIASCKKFLKPFSKKYNIPIFIAPNDFPHAFIFSDKLRLKQIMLNLLSNAIKYNRIGGSVTINITSRENCWVIEITDTGIGIDEQHLNKIFDPFYRIVSNNNLVEGTGIGLSVTSELVKALGGKIGVSSSNTGSTFWVSFSKYLGTATPDVAAANKELPPYMNYLGYLANKKILVLEYKLTNKKLIYSYIRILKTDADMFDNNSDALEKIKNGTVYDFIFIDCNRPNDNALTFAKAVRQWEQDSNSAKNILIAASTDTSEENRRVCISSGMDEFIPKPVSLEKIAEITKKYL